MVECPPTPGWRELTELGGTLVGGGCDEWNWWGLCSVEGPACKLIKIKFT